MKSSIFDKTKYFMKDKRAQPLYLYIIGRPSAPLTTNYTIFHKRTNCALDRTITEIWAPFSNMLLCASLVMIGIVKALVLRLSFGIGYKCYWPRIMTLKTAVLYWYIAVLPWSRCKLLSTII